MGEHNPNPPGFYEADFKPYWDPITQMVKVVLDNKVVCVRYDRMAVDQNSSMMMPVADLEGWEFDRIMHQDALYMARKVS